MRALVFSVILFSLFNSTTAFARVPSDFTAIAEQINSQDFTYNELKQNWQQHVLFPHIEEVWLTKNIERLSPKYVEYFLRQPENKAAAWFFQPKWQKELVRREEWPLIANSGAVIDDSVFACYYLKSLDELNREVPSIVVSELWQTGKSQPNHCGPYFKQWLNSQKNRSDLIWQRQLLAFYERNGSLLKHLGTLYFKDEYKALSEFLLEVYEDPKRIISKKYDPNSPEKRALALAAVNRMAYRDPRSASNLWLRILKVSPGIPSDEIQEASRYLGIAMAKQGLPESYYWLTIADPEKSDSIVQHWRLQTALAKGDYGQVLELHQELSEELKSTAQWKYWSGLALYKTNGFLDRQNPLYELSTKRLYYGYLAAIALGRAPSLDSSPDYPPIALRQVASIPALQRAKALFSSDEITRAQVEWNLWVKAQDNQVQHTAGELALSWGWYAKSTQAADWSGRYDLIHLRYPNAFGELVSENAKDLRLPEYWIHGVMRQESRFDPMALSHAGAYGLMQIMPATATSTAKKHRIQYSGTDDLYNPETNISIGSHYLRDLVEEFTNPIFATAAYNAGPSRVDAWKERFPYEMTIWIESIPFDETRNYVKSVLAYSQIYAITNETPWVLSAWTEPEERVAAYAGE